MKYETFIIKDQFTGVDKKYVTLFIDEENAKTFSSDPENSDYQQYLIDIDGGLPTPKQTEGE